MSTSPKGSSQSGAPDDGAPIAAGKAPSDSTHTSPRVSTIGTDDPQQGGRPAPRDQAFLAAPAAYAAAGGGGAADGAGAGGGGLAPGLDQLEPGLDQHHWGGVVRRPNLDARSVASSMNAEPRDDRSLYDGEGADDDGGGGGAAGGGAGGAGAGRGARRGTPARLAAGGGAGSLERERPAPADALAAPRSAGKDAAAAAAAAAAADAEPPASPAPPADGVAGGDSPLGPQSPMAATAPSLGDGGAALYQTSLDGDGLQQDDDDEELATIEIAPSAADEEPAPAPAASADGDDDDLTVYRRGGGADGAAAAAPPAGPGAVEPLQVERPAAAAAAAPAASASEARSEDPSAQRPAPGPPGSSLSMGRAWEDAFRGLLFLDGRDAAGRPVAVINADAVPPNMRSSALLYVKAHLEPVVGAGPYCVLFTARAASLPTLWVIGAYQSLPRPYRKNVAVIALARPSALLRALLAVMRPFVSAKAARKVAVVDDLAELGAATEGQLAREHLGAAFLEADAAAAAGAAEP